MVSYTLMPNLHSCRNMEN